MKLGILTYHRAINMGSIVQAYCLQKKLKAEFPQALVQVIDYRPGLRDYRESTRHLSRCWPFLSCRRRAEVRCIRRFADDVLELSPSHLTTRDLERSRRWIDSLGYDGIFVGSDTVWEYRPGSYSPPTLNEFHLPWRISAKKIAFAASADPVPLDGIPDSEQRASIAAAISDFDVLSLRDDATFRFLNRLGIDTSNVQKILDPTLHVDFSELVAQYKVEIPEGKPLAGVSAPEYVAPIIAARLRLLGFSVWNWSSIPCNWADGCLPQGLRAQEVLGAYRNLSTFVTDRFHGSIFAMKIGNVAPIFIESTRKWAMPNSKGRDLYRDLNISDRVLRDDAPNWIRGLDYLAAEGLAAPAIQMPDATNYLERVHEVLDGP